MSDSPNTWQSGIGYAIALVDKMRRRESPGEVEKIDALGEVLERLERKRDKRGTEDATEVLVKAWDGEAELVSLRAQVAALRAAGEAMAKAAASAEPCVGEWVSGSGGHKEHAGGCDRIAMWWDGMYAYCDEHAGERADGHYDRMPWRDVAAALARWREVAGQPATRCPACPSRSAEPCPRCATPRP